jgi:hypothetical protein
MVGAAFLALWTSFRFPQAAPESLGGAMTQVAIALAAGWLLVPRGMTLAIGWSPNAAGPLVAVFLFALPALVYLFLASLWLMRALQELMTSVRR